MTETIVMVLGNIERIKIEVEAMKLDNEIRKLQGCSDFNYSPNDFWEKANELQNAINELYR